MPLDTLNVSKIFIFLMIPLTYSEKTFDSYFIDTWLRQQNDIKNNNKQSTTHNKLIVAGDNE